MGLVTGFVVYAVMWWLVFFMVLPWGNQPPKDIQEGHATSAPENPRLGKKALITTGITAVVWTIFYFIQANNLITLSPPS